MFTLALAVALAVAPPRPVLVDSPALCPASAPIAVPIDADRYGHFYECIAPAPVKHAPKPVVKHHPAPKHHAPIHHRARKAAHR